MDADWTARCEALSTTFSADAADPALALRAGAAMDLSRLEPSASDPDLGLDAPAIFCQVHLNTKRNGSEPDGLNVAGVRQR